MTCFILDGAAAQVLGRRILESAPDLAGEFKLIDFSQLATLDTPDAGRFIFLGLGSSWPARVERSLAFESKLREAGLEVWNPPSMLAGCRSPVELVGRLAPGLEVGRAFSDEPSFPCKLRAHHGDSLAESGWVEDRHEYDAMRMAWLLRGTDPDLIHWAKPPVSPEENLPRIRSCVRMGGHVHFFGEPGSPELHSMLLKELNSSGRDLAWVDYWQADGRAGIWSVADGIAAILGRPGLPAPPLIRILLG